jgi:hypothetical protein
MEPEPTTFPTLRRWQRMSESEQDALLDKIETRRRRRAFGVRGLAVILCLAAMAIGIALVSGM